MSLFVERKLDTDYGTVDIAITAADHISVQGQPVVRDTKFNCHLHFWKQADGTYAVRDKDGPKMERAWLSGMSAAEYSKPAPPTYFAKVLAAYTRSVNDFMADNVALAVEAEDKRLTNDIESEEAKLRAMRKELQEKEEKIKKLRADRLALMRNQVEVFQSPIGPVTVPK
jgi:hypothetical protein